MILIILKKEKNGCKFGSNDLRVGLPVRNLVPEAKRPLQKSVIMTG